MRIDAWVLPALLLIGATPSRAYVELGADTVLLRLGFFRYRIPRRLIASASETRGSWGWGIGVHSDFFHWLTVNGSIAGMVELRLDPAARFHILGIPVKASRVYTSLQDPAGFVRALEGPV
jgi:hypothetical protein